MNVGPEVPPGPHDSRLQYLLLEMDVGRRQRRHCGQVNGAGIGSE
jgi:hypothetical protein